MIGSTMFLGWAISAVVLPRLSDIFGRRIIFIVSMAIQTVAFLGFFFLHSFELFLACMFIFGVASVGRCSISYLYLLDLLPSNRQVFYGTLLQSMNALSAIVGALYFWQISKNWLWICIFACSLGFIAMMGAIFILPESPKFLISKKRFDEARLAINHIASFNGRSQRFSGLFDTEVEMKAR